MLIYFIICVIIVLLAVIFAIFVVNNNRFQALNIKIDEAEKNIDSILNEKYNLLLSIGDFIKKKTKEETFDDLNNLNINELNRFELNDALAKYDKNITEYVEFNRDVKFDNKELEDFDNYSKLNVTCLACENYYNDTIMYFNKLIKKFPAKIIAGIKGYNEKKEFQNKKEEIFEILKK